jgi:hypothetical protein
MMPNAISATGPKIIEGDVNNDGLKDLFMAGSTGTENRIYIQQKGGKFSTFVSGVESSKNLNVKDAVFFDADADGDEDLYVVTGGNEFQENDPALQDKLFINNGKGKFHDQPNALPQMFNSGCSVTTGDFNHDGSPDLFVGGRSIPGKYPLSPRSYLLANNGKGKFTDVTSEFCAALLTPGMVTDAQFLDVNSDDFIDLMIVGEWMEPGVYVNEGGKKLERKTDALNTNASGWWLTMDANDFDKDGDTDVVLGNFGLNNPYHPDADQPVQLLYKDFDNNGSIDPILSYYIDDTLSFAYSRDELIGQIPSMKKKFTSYKTFASTRFTDYFSREQLAGSDTLSSALLASIYLQNNGDGKFTIRMLPVEAQFSPVYALASADVNNDGNLDIISGGNLTQTRVSSGQQDANYGIVFLGDGKGSFSTLDAVTSGLFVNGDVRDICVLNIKGSDYMLMSRNGESVKVFKLQKPVTGL